MNKEKVDISYIPGEEQILGVIENNIHVKGQLYEEENIIPVVLIISIDLHIEMLYKYFDAKRDYCKRYGHYCGVWGQTIAVKYEEVGSTMLLDEEGTNWDAVDENKEDIKYVKTRMFEVLEFDEHIDMEHG